MDPYLLPQADGLPTRPSGPWVAEKLHYLARYLYLFTTAMRDKQWRAMHYIDLFAGPGKCSLRGSGEVCLGSPLLALAVEHPFDRCFFADLEPVNIAALKQRVAASPLADTAECYIGDSNVIVQQVVGEILRIDRPWLPGRWPSLNLAFIDPEGLELHWDTVATLARSNRMDLLIHYPQSGLTRNMAQALRKQSETAVDRFFGGTEWREIYTRWQDSGCPQGIHRQLIDYYKHRLTRLGYPEPKEIGPEPLMRNARNAPLYRFIFASRHALGDDFWKKATTIDVHGQPRLPSL